MLKYRILATACAAVALAGCSQGRIETVGAPAAPSTTPITVKVIAFNDFHGALETPGRPIEVETPDGATVKLPAGGAAYFASAVRALKSENPNNVVVAAGDLTSASPLVSSLFLDEPTVKALSMAGLDFNAAGNHEFDRGTKELKRLQFGGCDKLSLAAPCQLEPFAGANYKYLTANMLDAAGNTLMPATGLKSFGSGAEKVTIGFIGMTTRETSQLVDPAGIAGYQFADEAETANRLIPVLKAQGADAIVIMVHEGGYTPRTDQPQKCDGLSGPILDIMDRLDPGVDLIVSGHTHRAYVCDYSATNPDKPILLTSAGNNGVMLTDINLTFDRATRKVIAKSARQVIVQGDGNLSAAGPIRPNPAFPTYAADPEVAAHVARYAKAAQPLAMRPVGKASGPLLRDAERDDVESPLGLLIADAQLAATVKDGAQVAFMNPGGVRAAITPAADGTVTFGDIYTTQPFGNNLQVREYSGAQLLDILEQQFSMKGGVVQLFAAGLTYSVDRSRPVGQRIIAPMVQGKPLVRDARYRVAMNAFLAGGGDGFTTLAAGPIVAGGMLDIDALEAYFARGQVITPPALGRVKDVTPKP